MSIKATIPMNSGKEMTVKVEPWGMTTYLTVETNDPYAEVSGVSAKFYSTNAKNGDAAFTAAMDLYQAICDAGLEGDIGVYEAQEIASRHLDAYYAS